MCCEKPKIVTAEGHCVDSFCLVCREEGINYDGYVPTGIGIGGGDEMSFDYCINCGKIQGDFPKSLEGLKGE